MSAPLRCTLHFRHGSIGTERLGACEDQHLRFPIATIPRIEDPEPTFISAEAGGATKLKYTSDYLEFDVTGDAPGTIDVNVLSSQRYPSETWRLVEGSPTGTVIASGTPNNTPVTVALQTTDNPFFVEFNSTGAPGRHGGNSDFSIGIPATPVPSALPLLAGGLVFFGLLARKRRAYNKKGW